MTIGSDGGMSSRSEDCLSGVIAGVVDDSLCKRDGGEEGLPIIPKLKPVFSSTLSKDGSFVCIWTSRCRMSRARVKVSSTTGQSLSASFNLLASSYRLTCM